VVVRDRIPNMVTAVGHGLTIWWIVSGVWWLGVAGLGCDVVDGAIARRMGSVTEFGGLYDWTVDVTMAAVICVVALRMPWLLLALVPGAVFCRRRGMHFSGRALLTLLAIGLAWRR
jgi:phosphatidylglycerophosphate synthase